MQKENAMTIKRTIALLLTYFIGYLWLVPQIAAFLTLCIDPQAQYFNVGVLTILYIVLILLCVVLSWNEWKRSFHMIKKEPAKVLIRTVTGGVLAIVLNVILSLLCGALSGQSDSANQEVIQANVVIAPYFMLFSIMIFAPMVEESVFRGGVFACTRRYFGFWAAALISAFAFGWIHVMDSFFAGQWQDLIYLIVYGGIGLFNAWYYEHHGGIIASAGVHLFNNLISYIAMIL